MRIAAAAAALVCVCAFAEDGYWGRSAEGWFWYREPPEEGKAPPGEAPPPAAALPEMESHRRLQRELLEQRAVAVMNPTPANVERYMRLQRHALDLSSKFADQWRRVVWSTPDLDYSLQHRPTNALAAAIHDERMRQGRTERLGDLAHRRGLALFFAPDCPLCGPMARILSQLQIKHGFHVMGVSAGGAVLEPLADVRPDNGIGRLLGVEDYPATFLFDPATRSAEPVGGGLMSLEEVEERIDVIAHFAPGSRF